VRGTHDHGSKRNTWASFDPILQSTKHTRAASGPSRPTRNAARARCRPATTGVVSDRIRIPSCRPTAMLSPICRRTAVSRPTGSFDVACSRPTATAGIPLSLRPGRRQTCAGTAKRASQTANRGCTCFRPHPRDRNVRGTHDDGSKRNTWPPSTRSCSPRSTLRAPNRPTSQSLRPPRTCTASYPLGTSSTQTP
jgi:hypothetical protein